MKKKLARIVVLLVIVLMVLPQMPVAGQDKVSITFWHMEEPAYRVERFPDPDRRVQRCQPRHRGQAGSAELGRGLYQGARGGRGWQRT